MVAAFYLVSTIIMNFRSIFYGYNLLSPYLLWNNDSPENNHCKSSCKFLTERLVVSTITVKPANGVETIKK